MRKIILASAVALFAATMTTGALAQRGHGSGGRGIGGAHFGGGHFGGFGRHEFGGREFERRDFDHRFAFRRRFFGPGFVAVTGWPGWYDDGDDCLSHWVRTPSGWRQRLC
jgi:hypothetical protein